MAASNETLTLRLKTTLPALKELGFYLEKEFPGCLIMPTTEGGKRPLLKHKNNAYTLETYKNKGFSLCTHGALILLTQEVIVVDIDDHQLCNDIERMFPVFKDTVICKTSKGKHYYFRRTYNCSTIKDGARQLALGDGSELPIDIKTITSCGTKGAISIPPSPNKQWINQLGKHPVIQLPDGFIDYFNQNKKTNRFEKQCCDVIRLPDEFGGGKSKICDDNSDNIQTQLVAKLISMLNPSRACSYDSWMQVGWCLYNIDDGLLPLWVTFSKPSIKFKPGECEDLWKSMKYKSDGLQLGSLHMWAKNDSPSEYKFVVHSTILTDILKCSGTTHQIAAIAWKMLKDKYVCALTNGKLWYYFDGTLWRIDGDALDIRRQLSTTVKEQFVMALNNLNMERSVDEMQSDTSNTTSVRADKDARAKLTSIITKLEENYSKNQLISEMREFFYDQHFLNNLDNNSDLIAFNNGVWDLKLAIFRNALPQDFVSLSVGYDFQQNINHSCRTKILKYWEMMHPNAEQRDYVLRMFARQLYGDEGCNLLHVHAGFQGSAGNGKTKFFEILEYCLGQYVCKFGVAFLTQKVRPDPGSAMPEYECWRGRRILYCTEPNHNDVLNTGIMKDLTGGESVTYRLLFSNVIQRFKPKFKLHIMCNDAPQVDGTDSGVKRRIRKIDYLAKFVDESEVDEENGKFQKVEGLLEDYKEVDNDMRMEFFRILSENYNHNYGFSPPQVIRNNSNVYLQDNDKVFNFIQDFIRKEKNGFFTLKDAKDVFKNSGYFNGKISTLKDDIQKALNTVCVEQVKLHGTNTRNVFLGFSLKKTAGEEDTIEE
jgi:phage/plasmid-associated DNA primase